MAGKPKNFQAISNVLANYNFVDIASGTGYINFYAGNTVDLKLLSNFTYYSDVLYNAASTTGAGDTKILDLDFDILINRPMDIRGLGIVNIPHSLFSTAGAGTAYIKARVRKWNGVTETEIIDNNSSVSTCGPNGAVTYYYCKAVDLTIPLTHFKVGEYLRLTIEGWATRDGATNITLGIGNDPKNRTSDGSLSWDTTGAVPSQLIFQCPVRLNL